MKIDHADEGSKLRNGLRKVQLEDWFDFVWVRKNARGCDDVTKPWCFRFTPVAFSCFDGEIVLFEKLEDGTHCFDMVFAVVRKCSNVINTDFHIGEV